MCGIVLMMSNDKLKLGTQRAKAFTQGVIIDTLRGPHSTGLVYADYDGGVETYKKPIPGYDFVNMPKFKSVLDDPEDHPFLIAHNRWATQGKVNTANAHPFQHGHITGVHNGSLYTWRDLAPNENFQTDSEYIFHALANNDTGDVIKEIDGAFALVWHDSSDNTMHIARNDERTFYLAHIKNSTTVLGASESEMLDLMCARNNLDVEEQYLVNTEVELVFNLDDLNKPEVIEREMSPPWEKYYQSKKGGTGSQTGGTHTNGSVSRLPLATREVVAYYDDFEFHNDNSTWGFIKGTNLDAPYDEVRISGFTKEEVGLMDTKDGYFTASYYLTGRDADGTEYLSLNRSTLKWLSEDEAMYMIVDDDDGSDDEEETTVEEGVIIREDYTSKKWYKRAGESTHYTSTEAMFHLMNGCCTCGDPIELQDYEELEWWNTEPICKKCSITEVPFSLGV